MIAIGLSAAEVAARFREADQPAPQQVRMLAAAAWCRFWQDSFPGADQTPLELKHPHNFLQKYFTPEVEALAHKS